MTHPAPGFRDSGINGQLGALCRVGNYGYSYSSAISSANGVFLNFYTQNLYPSYSSNRGHGIQLRCLSE